MTLHRHRRIFRPAFGQIARRALRLCVAGGASVLLAWAVVVLWQQIGPHPAAEGPRDAQTISANGDAVAIIDAETLRLGNRVVRLDGISAPPRGEACRFGSQDCAVSAVHALTGMIAGRTVSCALRDVAAERAAAVCQVGEVVLNDALVRGGWAHAARGQARLAAFEREARDAGRGLWRTGDW